MSQLYKIQLKTSVSESFTLNDAIVHRLDLTSILPQEEMVDILKGVLTQEGFVEQEDGTYTAQGADGEVIVFDLDEMQVSAQLEEEKSLQTDVVVQGQAWDSRSEARHNAQAQLRDAKDAAKSQLETESKKLQKELSQKLADGESARVRQMNEILQQVYAESLKRKAGQLGDIMDIKESTHEGQYELVIHIEQ